MFFFFFFNDTATTEIYTLSLHDALPICKASFRPPESVRALRAYHRQRQMVIRSAAAHVQHMPKALEQMNVKLTEVRSDITGVTGLRIIPAILAGERGPHTLAGAAAPPRANNPA